MIAKSTSHVTDGTKSINNAGTSLKAVIEKIDHVSQLIATIASNAKEQALGISEINIGVNQLDQVTQRNAGMVVASSQQGSDLVAEAQILKETISKFKVSNQVEIPGWPAFENTRHLINRDLCVSPAFYSAAFCDT